MPAGPGVFDASSDQAAGLRQLFPPNESLRLLAVGCASGDARDRAGVEAIAAALGTGGSRTLLVDLGGAREAAASGEGCAAIERIDARKALPEGADARRLARFVRALRTRDAAGAGAFDAVLVAGDALRVADLAAGLADGIVLVAPARAAALANTYSQIKALHLAHGFARYCVAFVDADSRASAATAHRRLADTATRFLGVAVEFGGVLRAGGESLDWNRFAATWNGWQGAPAPRLRH